MRDEPSGGLVGDSVGPARAAASCAWLGVFGPRPSLVDGRPGGRLAGARPATHNLCVVVVHYHGVRPGHSLNVALVEELLSCEENYTTVDVITNHS